MKREEWIMTFFEISGNTQKLDLLNFTKTRIG